MSNIYTRTIDYYGEEAKILILPFKRPSGDSEIERWIDGVVKFYPGYEHLYTASELGDIEAPEWYNNPEPNN